MRRARVSSGQLNEVASEGRLLQTTPRPQATLLVLVLSPQVHPFHALLRVLPGSAERGRVKCKGSFKLLLGQRVLSVCPGSFDIAAPNQDKHVL
eukprot:3933880-Rhodomonas_salina.1